MADTDTNPTNPVLAAAKLEADLAKARKEKAEADLATMKAQLSPLTDQSKITAPSGDVTATSDQAGFVETQMLAQEAARVIAGQLKDRLTRAKVETLIIYNSAEVASLSALAAVLKQVEQLAGEFDAQEPSTSQALNDAQSIIAGLPPVLQPESTALASALILGPSIATGVVKSVVELVNLFRTTTDFKRQTVTVTEDMIVSYLVKEFGEKVSVYYPVFFPPNVVDESGSPGFAAALNTLNDKRNAAQTQIQDLEAMETDLTNKMTTAPGDSAKIQPVIVAVQKAKSSLQLLNTAVDQLTATLRTPDATSKVTPLSQLIRAERLALIMKEPSAFTLRLNVTANGTTMIRKNAFTSARAEHSAGVSLVYQLFDLTGKIVNADALQFYFEFKTAQDVRQIVNS